MDVVAKLRERIATLQAQREQSVAQVNAITGAIQVCELLLAELTAPPAPETPPAPPAEPAS